MDITGDDQDLQAVLGRDLGIDNEALDFQQLEAYITNDNNMCFPEDAISAMAYGNGRPLDIGDNVMNKMAQNRLQAQHQAMSSMYLQGPPSSLTYKAHTALPDSPPDSGSEPYSPPDDHQGHQDSKHNSISATMNSSLPPQMYHRPPPTKGFSSYINHEPPKLNHLPTSTQHQPMPIAVNQQMAPQMMPQYTGMNSLAATQGTKKRKYSDSPNNTISANSLNGLNGMLNIKQEPPGYLLDCSEDDYSYDFDSGSNFIDGSYQVIKWQAYQPTKWCVLTDGSYKELPTPSYRVDSDKGFNFSTPDDSFVCQKKNHFQVTVHIGLAGDPKYVKSPDGLQKIDGFCLHFHGIKMESPTQSIKIEQSQSDRSKKAFYPVKVDLPSDQVTKITVGRLHYSETTSNNMRKKGKPNPDQRYFMLVVSLHAHSGDESTLVASHVSERLIVRASNPGQFESDVDVLWQKGHGSESVYHIGKVGINTDHPEEALTIHGNLKLTGHLVQPSDIRAKEDISPLDTKDQLRNVSKMNIYKYSYKGEYAEQVGISDDERMDTGVIAQEMMHVLPDAVRETGDVILKGGHLIENFLVVNKDRIFMENVGAVKELCKLTDNLENRIDELERMNKKLTKLKRYDSLKSTISSKSCSSVSTVSSTPQRKYPPHIPRSPSQRKSTPHAQPVDTETSMCSNKFIQITIIVLILVMAFCLVSITVLYILERNKSTPISNSNVQFSNGGALNTTIRFDSPPTEKSFTEDVTTQEKRTTHSVTTPTTLPIVTSKLLPALHHCEDTTCEEQCCPLPYQDDMPHVIINNHNEPLPPYDYLKNTSMRDATKKVVYIHDENNNEFLTGVTSKTVDHDDQSEVIVNRNPSQSVLEDPMVHANTQDELMHTQSDDLTNEIDVVYRVKRDTKTADTALQTIFSVLECNYTIGQVNCEPNMCHHGNYTYVIRMSPYFGLTAVTLQLKWPSPTSIVQLCNSSTKGKCKMASDSEYAPLNLTTAKELTSSWQIPIGFIGTYTLTFRVSQSEHNLCHIPASENSFTEYTLIFRRTCLLPQDRT